VLVVTAYHDRGWIFRPAIPRPRGDVCHHPRVRCLATALAVILLAAPAPGCERREALAPGPAPAVTASPLRLVVLVVVDQLPSWSFERDRAHLTGGFARLLAEGHLTRRAVYPYAATYTAAGHAALSTGAPPAVTGFPANGWYRPALGRDRSSHTDEASPTFAIPGISPRGASAAGVSGRALRVEGLADVLRRATGGRGRSVALAIKGYAACFVAGREPDLAVWYEPRLTALTTSRWYADALPPWLLELAQTHSIPERLDDTWSPRDPALLARLSGVPDNSPGEGAEHEMGTTFPYALARATDPAKALRATAFADTILVDAALAAVDAEHLGEDPIADLLAVSFSAHDYAGHQWGQESWERLEVLLRLDEELARLLRGLDRRVGRDGYAVVLTSDHGATPLIEHSLAAGGHARRITQEALEEVAEAAAARVLGPGDWVAAISASTLYVVPALRDGDPARRDRALDAMVAALAAVDGMAFVRRTDGLVGDCDARPGLDALVCRSLVPGESGEIYLAGEDGSLITSYTTGTSHGTASDADRQVPLIVRVPGRPPGESDEPVSILRVAPTLAKLLGIPPPPAATEPPLW
jgi:predicted AlkP superfamily pyrophosphatase or phosphodiesterase